MRDSSSSRRSDMRDSSSSRWYIPLVASTEVARLSGDLTVIDPGEIIGTLPDAVPTPMANAVLWLDSSKTDSVILTGGLISTVLDQSGNNNHATQALPALRPALDSGPGIDFTD